MVFVAVSLVNQFAEETLPLQEIASGPADSLGLGPEFRHHSALGFVLQDLRRFPGKGWPLIRAGLQSPVVSKPQSGGAGIGGMGSSIVA